MNRPAIVIFALLVGCSGSEVLESVSEPEDNPPSTLLLDKVGGDRQADTVMRRLDNSLRVEVKRSDATPFADAIVNFRVVTEGGGEPFAGVVETDSLGMASDFWDLGEIAGEHRMEVRAVIDDQPVAFDTFTATAMPGRAISFQLEPSDTAIFSFSLDTRPLTRGTAEDEHGNAVPLDRVSWEPVSFLADSLEAEGWAVALLDGLRDSVAVTALYDLTQLSGWSLSEMHINPNITADDGCPSEASDSVRTVVASIDSVKYDGAAIAKIEFYGPANRTVWCLDGSILEATLDVMMGGNQSVDAIISGPLTLISSTGLPRAYADSAVVGSNSRGDWILERTIEQQ